MRCIREDLPGVDPDPIGLSVVGNQLTRKATRRTDLAKGERMIVREQPSATSPAP